MKSDTMQPGSIMNMIMRTKVMSGQQQSDKEPWLNPLGEDKPDAQLQQLYFDEEFLSVLVDQSAGFCCLKLLVMMLNAHSKALNTTNTKSKLGPRDRKLLIDELKLDSELIVNLLKFREEHADKRKMHDLVTYICKLIYKLDNH